MSAPYRFPPTVPGHRPLRTLFLITSMPVGGAETLLVNLIRGFHRDHIAPELCCTKRFGPLGEMLSREIPAYERMLNGKFDLRVLPRLTKLMRRREIDAVVTVGCGDKMFWGRLAAYRAGVPVVLSAIHSTGWPDSIGWLNRRLTPLTDAFIAVARQHGRFLVKEEGLPCEKVRVIPNGVDTERFRPDPEKRQAVRREWAVSPETPVCGIVAALRPEKNHRRFLQVAARVARQVPAAQFLIVGDGPERETLRAEAAALGIDPRVHFLGNRGDVEAVLAAMDVFLLTSDNEANPVSILEAMAVGLPVVAPHVGSIGDTVRQGRTGYLFEKTDVDQAAGHLIELFGKPELVEQLGRCGREVVQDHWSLQAMVEGYENLIAEIYREKWQRRHPKAQTQTNPTGECLNEQISFSAGNIPSSETTCDEVICRKPSD